MTDRNLGQIIDSIVAVAPDLGIHFTSLRESIRYTAPEAMTIRWRHAYAILNEHASDHEHMAVIGRIFSGNPTQEGDDETETN